MDDSLVLTSIRIYISIQFGQYALSGDAHTIFFAYFISVGSGECLLKQGDCAAQWSNCNVISNVYMHMNHAACLCTVAIEAEKTENCQV